MNAILALAGTGGPIIAILAILSFSTLTLIIVKIVQLAGINSGGTNRTDALMQWSQKDKEASVALIVNGRSPIDRVMHYALHSTMMRMPRKPLEAELLRRGNAEIAQMNTRSFSSFPRRTDRDSFSFRHFGFNRHFRFIRHK